MGTSTRQTYVKLTGYASCKYNTFAV